MTRLTFEDYAAHIRSDSARFRELLAATDPATPVPSCPEWTAADLLWHLTGVHTFWAHVVANRPAAPEDYVEPERPDSTADLLAAFDAATSSFQARLAEADPGEAAWSWSAEQTVGFTFRRQAHEALIHRLDAELTAGTVTDLDPRLAADGVHEALDVMFGGTPAWGTFTGGDQFIRVDSIDTDHHVWVQLGRFAGTDPEGTTHDEDDIHVVEDPGTEPDAVVAGTAADLDAWLWHRRDDTGISVAGDPAAIELFRSCVDHPID